MPLSEEELRQLEQMERALIESDPKFAATLRGTSFRRAARRKAILAGILFVVGIAVLMAGAILELIPLGVLGFVVMLGAATFGLSAWRGHTHQAQTDGADAAAAPEPHGDRGFTVIEGGRKQRRTRAPRNSRGRTSGSFMQRLDQRWRRRRDQGGY